MRSLGDGVLKAPINQVKTKAQLLSDNPVAVPLLAGAGGFYLNGEMSQISRGL
ncbi:MAG TPA: hypothetical protein V6C85_01665 [Allocoleopsis sp.]